MWLLDYFSRNRRYLENREKETGEYKTKKDDAVPQREKERLEEKDCLKSYILDDEAQAKELESYKPNIEIITDNGKHHLLKYEKQSFVAEFIVDFSIEDCGWEPKMGLYPFFGFYFQGENPRQYMFQAEYARCGIVVARMLDGGEDIKIYVSRHVVEKVCDALNKAHQQALGILKREKTDD